MLSISVLYSFAPVEHLTLLHARTGLKFLLFLKGSARIWRVVKVYQSCVISVVQFANCVSPNHSRLPLSLHLSQYWVADHLHSLYSISPRPLWCIWRLYFSRLREYGEGCHVRRYSQFDLSGPWIFLLFQLTPVYMSGLWFCLLRFSDTPRFGLYANVCLALLTKPVHIFLWPPVPLAVLTSPLDCSGARSCLSGRHSQTPYIL